MADLCTLALVALRAQLGFARLAASLVSPNAGQTLRQPLSLVSARVPRSESMRQPQHRRLQEAAHRILNVSRTFYNRELSPVFLSIPAVLLAATLVPTHQGADDLISAREAAFTAWANDSVSESLTSLASAIRVAASELNAAPASKDAAWLASQIEYALIRLQTFGGGTRNSVLIQSLLEGITLPTEHGGAYARLAWIRNDCTDSLNLLVNWQFVGPFDNERGAGMETELIAQSKPEDTEYAGKVRTVFWRPTPDAAPRQGHLRFARLIDPSTQACVLARSWVESPEASDCLLQLGFEQEVRVWLNGVPVFEAIGEHAFARDAFAVRLELEAGWNELSVLVGARDGSPAFTARLTRPTTGTPLDLTQVKEAPAGRPAKILATTAVDSSLTVTPPGLRSLMVAWDESANDMHSILMVKEDSADDMLTRSHFEAFFKAAPSKSHPGRTSAKSATELEPDNLRARVQYAILLRGSSSSAEQDVNPWLHAIEDVLAIDDKLAWAWRQKAYHAGWNQPTYQRALDQVERALATNPQSILALDMKLLLLEHLDQGALANRIRGQILALPNISTWPAIAHSCASSLPSSDPRRQELSLAWYAASGSVKALNDWNWRASRAREAGDPSPIEHKLALRIARNPWTVSARLDAAKSHLTLGDSARALELLDEANSLAPDRSRIHYWRARAHLLAENADQAIAALERELELDYSAEDERRLLEHLRSTGSAPFHEEYREPLLDIIGRVIVDPEATPHLPSREVIFKRLVVKVNPDGTAKRYFRTIERILSEKGARDRDAIRFSSYSNQDIRVLLADVTDINGDVRHARTGRTGGRMVVDLPPLSVGDVIDLEWRVDDLRPTFFGSYFGLNETFSPDPSIPVYESEIVILTPEEFPLQYHTRGGVDAAVVVQKDDGLTERTWIAKAIFPVKPESLMPPLEESMPAVQATSYESWDAFGAWWWNLTEEEIRVSPEMASKVTELIDGKESPLAKLRAIYDFVVTDIRYNAWEFGVHGYQPYEAPVIFSRGFGDCKDKAILLRALLGEAGIEAWPVLIRAEQRRLEEDQALALVEHFNHCIAFVPEQEGIPEMFLDGTARHHPLEVLPAMDNGAKVLIVRADGIELRTVPVASAEDNHIRSEFEVRIAPDRSAQVTLKRQSHGRFDPADRGRFTGSDEQRTEQAQNIAVSLFGPIEGEVSATFSDLEDLSESVSMELEVHAKQVARPNEKGFELPAAISKLDLLRTLASETDRKTDLLLDVPRSNTTVIHYELPPGSNPLAVPPAVHIECPDASYDWSAKIVEGSFQITEEFSLRSSRIAKENYTAFRELARKVDATQNAMLEVEVKP